MLSYNAWNYNDGGDQPGELPWTVRLPMLVEHILAADADVVVLQEIRNSSALGDMQYAL